MSGTGRDAVPAEVWRVAAVVVLGAFMAGLDTSLVNVGIDTIARELHGGLADAQWVTTGYLLALAAALPAGPWLQRRFGAARVWLGSLVAFSITSVLCAAAPSLAALIGARLLQGVSGGLLVPAGQSVLGRAAGAGRMGRVMSTAGIAVVLAPAVGPAIGGLLIASLSWRWLFLVNVPIGVVATIAGLRVLDRGRVDPTARLDVVGLVLLALGLPATTYGLVEVGNGLAAAGGAVTAIGAVLLAAFVARAVRRARRRSTAPQLLDLALFARRPYAAAQATVLLTGVSLFGGLILLPLYYEVLRGTGTGQTGLLLLAYGAGSAVTLRLGGVLTDRVGGGTSCQLGLAIAALATAPFVFLPPHADLVLVEALQFLRGAGVSLAGLPAMSAAFAAASDRLADATTTANIVQRVGGSVGSAALVLVIAHVDDRAAGFRVAFALLVVVALAALVAATTLRRASARARTPEPS